MGKKASREAENNGKVKIFVTCAVESPFLMSKNCYQWCGRVTVVGVLDEEPVWSGHRGGVASCSVVQL